MISILTTCRTMTIITRITTTSTTSLGVRRGTVCLKQKVPSGVCISPCQGKLLYLTLITSSVLAAMVILMQNKFQFIFRDTRIDVGHQIEDMLISCSYNGFKCYAECVDFQLEVGIISSSKTHCQSRIRLLSVCETGRGFPTME